MNKLTTQVAAESTAAQRSKGRQRLRAIAISVGAVHATWALLTALGVGFRSPAFGDQPTQEVGLAAVTLAALVPLLAGWGLLAALERRVEGAGRIWSTVAVVGLVLSLGGPFSGSGIETSTRVALASLHVVAGLVFIPLMHRTTTSTGGAE